jgi:hypothetical protein
VIPRLSAAVLALAVALLVAASAGAAPAAPLAPETLALRLHDLGPGYTLTSNSGCGSAIAGESATPALTSIYLDHPHTGCSTELMQRWAPPGSPQRPELVVSAAFAFADAAGPALELAHPRDVVAYVTGTTTDSLTSFEPAPGLGDEALSSTTDDAPVSGLIGRPRPGAVVLWRSGSTLALLLVGGLPDPAAEQEALRLAAIQQQRIATPTPLRPGENDDLEVSLDNPRLGIGVRWLGRRFDPPGPLPRLALTQAEGPIRPGEGPGGRVSLDYGTRPFASDVNLALWRPRAWRRSARSRFGRLVWDERCVRADRSTVPGGRAVIYASYERPPTSCATARPDRFLAHVFFDDMVVSVNAVGCWRCREGGGPYDSMAGMRAIVRALRIREPTAEAPAP